jgi:glycosyltransferase involved in cell wall biosynthesis
MSLPQPILVASNHGEIVGGGEISLLCLLEGLDRTRWAPTVVVPTEGPVASRCRALGFPVSVIPWHSLRRPRLAALRSVDALQRLARSTNARLLHANGSRVMGYAGLAGRWSGLPVIWHVRIADCDRLLDRLLAPLAHAIIVNSQAVARRFEWTHHKVRCIHNGVDLVSITPRPASPFLRISLGLPEGVPVVASVGRFVAFKGYVYLLEAARLVHRVAPAVHWLLVGDGELRGELEGNCRRLGIEPQVHFTGWREDVCDLLALCDIFVLPSLGEPFGRVLIEAMAMKRAVVATDAGGVPEIVDDRVTGLLVPPADPAALADAITTLLSDPARARAMGEAGRARAETHFSLERHADQVMKLYTKVLWEARGR